MKVQAELKPRTHSTDARSENAHLVQTDMFADCFMENNIKFESYSRKMQMQMVTKLFKKLSEAVTLGCFNCCFTSQLHEFRVSIRGNFIRIYFHFYRDRRW